MVESIIKEFQKNQKYILETEDRFLFKYFINEFSKLKIPSKMTSKELEEYEKKIMVYI